MPTYGRKDSGQVGRAGSGFSYGPACNPASRMPPVQGMGQTPVQNSYGYARYVTGPDGATYMLGQDGTFYRVDASGDAAGAGIYGMSASPWQFQQEPQEDKCKKRGAAFWVGTILAILCLLAAGLIVWNMVANAPSERQGDLGDLSSLNDSEIQAQIDELVENSMFNISIASQVDFPSGTEAGEVKIENPASNSQLMQVRIVRDDSGEEIYETGVIEPNHHIVSDTLAVDLPAGTYPCTAQFYALDPQTEVITGQASARITVNVLS